MANRGWSAVETAEEQAICGIKVLNTLSLYLRQKIFEGPLVRADDPRFDPMWEAGNEVVLPVFMHASDHPDAFFAPTDRFNERWEEPGNHPDWSFYGNDVSSKTELAGVAKPCNRAPSPSRAEEKE